MVDISFDDIADNLDNINVQRLLRKSPGLQSDQAEYLAREKLQVAHPEGDPLAGTIVPVDKWLVGHASDNGASVLNLALTCAEPRAAAGVAVFGLGLVSLPLIAKAHEVDEGLEVEKVGVQDAIGFTYDRCRPVRGDEGFKRPLTQEALEARLGPVDPCNLASEILRSEEEAANKERCSDDEISRLQTCIANSRAAVRRLRRRSALAFMGLRPTATHEEVGQRYKRMALEMHPDKGGDAETFQQLQDMRDRLTKSIQEEEDEEAKKRIEEEDKSKDLPPNARSKQLRQEAHKEAVKLWDSAREAEAEMFTDKGMLKGDPAPVLSQLRSFVEQFSNAKCRRLAHGSKVDAQKLLVQFLSDGLELIALAALMDPAGTANMVATHINYKIVARSGSKEVARDAQALLVAIADVPRRVEGFLAEMGRERSAAQEAEGASNDDQDGDASPLNAGEEVLVTSREYGEEEGTRGMVLGRDVGGIKIQVENGRRLVVARKDLIPAPPRKADKVSEEHHVEHKEQTNSSAPQREETSEVARPGPRLLAKSPDLPPDPEREDWDPEFTHPYVGALGGAGDGIFCRACRRWLPTRKFAHEPFLRHARAAHKVPPPGWKGPVPKSDD